MLPLPSPDNRLYLGKGGSGKTTLALAHSWRFPRAIILDPNSETAHGQGADVLQNDRAGLVRLVAGKRWRVCWRFAPADRFAAFDWACRAAWEAGDCCILWDEADRYHNGPRMTEQGELLWNMGRHRRVRVLACSRRPYKVSPDCTGNLSAAYVFSLLNKRDRDWIADHMDDEASEATKTLEPHGFIEWTENGWQRRSPLARAA